MPSKSVILNQNAKKAFHSKFSYGGQTPFLSNVQKKPIIFRKKPNPGKNVAYQYDLIITCTCIILKLICQLAPARLGMKRSPYLSLLGDVIGLICCGYNKKL